MEMGEFNQKAAYVNWMSQRQDPAYDFGDLRPDIDELLEKEACQLNG